MTATIINTLLKKLTHRSALPAYSDYTLQYVRHALLTAINSLNKEPLFELTDIQLSLAPNHVAEHITLDGFICGKKLKTNPIAWVSQTAEQLNALSNDLFVHITPVKGYLNIQLNTTTLITHIFNHFQHIGDRYGHSDLHQQKVAVIDYSGPNIAKPIGIGHLRSTIIGQSLANIYEATGYSVLKINHIGDWGTQFGALIYAHDHLLDKATFKDNPIGALKDIYVQFHALKQDQPELEDKAREHFKNLELKKPHETTLWQTFRQLSIDSFEDIYNQFNVSFDAYLGESFYIDQVQTTIDQVQAKGLCQTEATSDLLTVQDLDKLPTFLLRKADGTSLYITRDLAALLFRSSTFKPDTILYLVGNEQSLHFKQLFALYNKLDAPAINQLAHIGFGLILADGKKMSTRAGSLIELTELIEKTKTKCRDILTEKGTTLSEDDIHVLATGSIIYNDLSRTRTKDIDFNWNTMLSFESGSSIYLQYTYARICSILRKQHDRFTALTNTTTFQPQHLAAEDTQLWLQLLFFPKVLEDARRSNMPNGIANYLEDLAQLFNSFYAKHSIKESADALFLCRYHLLTCINIVLKNGLACLNIGTLQRM